MIGVLNAYKPKNKTSGAVVLAVKKLLNIRQVGHLGTLDPLASGVLPLTIGKATKLFDYFLTKRKTYIAEFTFGYQTNTLDLEGEIEKTCDYIPTESELKNAIKEYFLGKIPQKPPDFSSKKINGQTAHKLARAGIKLDLAPKEIEIYEFELLSKIDEKTFSFKITCSAGTYIRSIARDLGEYVKSCGTMTNLKRTNVGEFLLTDALNFEEFTRENIEKNIIPLETVLSSFDKISVTELEFKKLRDGIKIDIIGAKNTANDVCVCLNGKVVGMGKIAENKLRVKTYFV